MLCPLLHEGCAPLGGLARGVAETVRGPLKRGQCTRVPTTCPASTPHCHVAPKQWGQVSNAGCLHHTDRELGPATAGDTDQCPRPPCGLVPCPRLPLGVAACGLSAQGSPCRLLGPSLSPPHLRVPAFNPKGQSCDELDHCLMWAPYAMCPADAVWERGASEAHRMVRSHGPAPNAGTPPPPLPFTADQ